MACYIDGLGKARTFKDGNMMLRSFEESYWGGVVIEVFLNFLGGAGVGR